MPSFIDQLVRYDAKGTAATVEDDPFLDQVQAWASRKPVDLPPLPEAERPRALRPSPELTEEEIESVRRSMEPKGPWTTWAEGTIPGQIGRAINRAAVGPGYIEPAEGDFGYWGNKALGLASFVGDPTNLALAGGGKLAAEAAVEALGKRGLTQMLGEKALPTAIEKGIEAGAFLGGHTAVSDPARQYRETGGVDPLLTLKRAQDSAISGLALGPASGLGKLTVPAEILAFTVAGPALENRAPVFEDLVDSTFAIAGIRGVGLGYNGMVKLAALARREIPPSRKEYAEATGEDVRNVPNEERRMTAAQDAAAKLAKIDAAAQEAVDKATGVETLYAEDDPRAVVRVKETVDADQRSALQGVRGVEEVRPQQGVGGEDRPLDGGAGAVVPPQEGGQVQEEGKAVLGTLRQPGEVQPGTAERPGLFGQETFDAVTGRQAELPLAARAESNPPDVAGQGVMGISAVQRIAEQTDIPPGAIGVIAGPFRVPLKSGKTVEAPTYWPNSEVARRMENARDLPSAPSIIQRTKDFLSEAWHKVARIHEELPETPANVGFRTGFDALTRVGDLAREDATRTVAAVVSPFPVEGPLKLFVDKLTIENELRNLDAGREPRFGFKDRAEIEASRAAIDAEVARDPKVQKALANRKAVLDELIPRLVTNKVLKADALENPESYFHQEVLQYANLNERMLSGVGKLKLAKAGFQKARAEKGVSAEDYDYLRNYIEAESRWLADAHARLRTSEIRDKYFEPDNIYSQLTESVKGTEAPWHDLMPDTHDVYVPRYGSPLYRALSIPERFGDMIQDEVLSDALKLSELRGHTREVLALGKSQDVMVLPKEVVRQLELVEAQMKHRDGVVGQAWGDGMRLWKLWTTQGPKRVIPYNVRNAMGDLDAAIVRGPRALRFAAEHTGELRDYMGGKLGVSSELRGALDHGAINSGFAAKELVDLRDMVWFRKFFQGEGNPAKIPAKAVAEYFRVASRYTAFRENILRYGVYLDFLKDIRDGTLTNFGATNKTIAKALIAKVGPEAAAARMTNDLLIDYANRPAMTKWLRSKAMPFAAFMEANARRYPRIFWNLLDAGDYVRASKYAGFTITKATATALLGMFRLSRVAWLTGALYAWNYLVHPDEEKEIDTYTRQAPHAILGRNPDGSIIVMRDLSAIGDFLETLGLPTGINLYGFYRRGQVEATDIAKEAGKSVANKVLQQIRPELKALYEVPSGTTTFPDAFNPRQQDRAETMAGYLGLQDEYRAAKGMVLQEGDRARPHMLQRTLAGIIDPRQNAMGEAIELRTRFLESKGEESDRGGISKTRNMRRAAMSGDFDAFQEAFDVYLSKGGTGKSFEASLQHINPIRSLPLKYRAEFVKKYLSADQRNRLNTAMNYSSELQSTMISFWQRASETKERLPLRKAG